MEKYNQNDIDSLKEHLKSLSIDDMHNLLIEVFMKPEYQTVLLGKL